MNYKERINNRYEKLRRAGFNSKLSTRYKYHNDKNVDELIARKGRTDQLMYLAKYDFETAWKLADEMNDSDIKELIKEKLG